MIVDHVHAFKLDVDGNLVWSDNFGDATDQCAPFECISTDDTTCVPDRTKCTTALAADSGNNMILAGGFLGSMNLGGEDLTAPGESEDAFLTKLGP